MPLAALVVALLVLTVGMAVGFWRVRIDLRTTRDTCEAMTTVACRAMRRELTDALTQIRTERDAPRRLLDPVVPTSAPEAKGASRAPNARDPKDAKDPTRGDQPMPRLIAEAIDGESADWAREDIREAIEERRDALGSWAPVLAEVTHATVVRADGAAT